MPTLVDLTPLLWVARYAATAYAVTATVLTTACLALHFVTRVDRVARRAGGRVSGRPLFVPLEQAPAAS
jgi:hypothetical protein